MGEAESMDVTISVPMTRDMERRLKAAASRVDRPVAYWVRQAIEGALQAEPVAAPKE